jgi:hypothetical protein
VEKKKMRKNRRERFVELAEKRMGKALHQIKLISNLADKSNYEYTQEDAEKMISTLHRALEDCELRYRQGGKDEHTVFKL